MKIAVIGAGISGNSVARLLAGEHDVWLFEAEAYAGGHTNTVSFEAWGQSWAVDTGFMVFNDRTYPNFIRLLQRLGVAAQDSDMSFSVSCARTGPEYQGSSLNGLFAQRRNLVRPAFYRLLRDVLRFNRTSPQLLDTAAETLTLGEYLDRSRYSREFVDQYLLPMTAAIWSAQPRAVLDFPAHFLIGFFRNHGLLQVWGRPQWKTIPGGAQRYVAALLDPLGDRVRLRSPVTRITRHADYVEVTVRDAPPERFDAVVCAAHADQTLAMLADADDLEREILGAFPYQRNEAILHTDTRVLPRRRRAWASWNYHLAPEPEAPATVTYDLSRLQRINSPQPILLTLNDTDRIDPATIIQRIDYHHPAYGTDSINAQRRHAELHGRRRTYFCGAYWGYGFHEDGLRSGLTVAHCFGKDLDTCIAVSMKDGSDTAATNR